MRKMDKITECKSKSQFEEYIFQNDLGIECLSDNDNLQNSKVNITLGRKDSIFGI